MIYLDDNSIFLTQYKEINYSKEYSDIKSYLVNSDCAASLDDDTFIIFRVFDMYEGSENDENDDVFTKILHICGVQVIYNPLEEETILTDEPYDEQFMNIYNEYEKEYKIDVGDVLKMPFVLSGGRFRKFMLVPVIVN